jgi:hypothetical protein
VDHLRRAVVENDYSWDAIARSLAQVLRARFPALLKKHSTPFLFLQSLADLRYTATVLVRRPTG